MLLTFDKSKRWKSTLSYYVKERIKKWQFVVINSFKNPTELNLNRPSIRIIGLTYLIVLQIYFYKYDMGIFLNFGISVQVGFGLIVCYIIFSDMSYYRTFCDTKNAIGKLSPPKKGGMHTSGNNLEAFQINYNKLRKKLKRRIENLNYNFQNYEYENENILRDIDIFFNTTIQILYKERVMNLPYTPKEDYQDFLDEHDEQTPDDDEGCIPAEVLKKEFDEADPFNYDFWDIKKIDYSTIYKFLNHFENIFIQTPKARTINIVAMAEFFERWNQILEKLEPDIYKESKNKIDKYYTEKESFNKSRNGYVFKIIYTIAGQIIAFLIAITISLMTSSYWLDIILQTS